MYINSTVWIVAIFVAVVVVLMNTKAMNKIDSWLGCVVKWCEKKDLM